MVQLWLLRYRLLNLQWGCDIGGSYAARRDISFPLTFPTACYSVCTSRGRANTSSYSEGPIELYASKFVYIGAQDANSSYNSCSWIAVGEQQWGYLSKSSNKTLTFPIAFTQSVYSVLRTAVNDSSGYIRGNETGIVSFSLTSVSVGESQYWASYLFAIGKQQCGYTTSINGGDALSFPIAFSTTNYVITGSTYDDLLIYCPKFTDKTTTTCVMYNGIGHVSYNGTSRLDWIALGK